jgi:hypothetical protein
VVPEPDVVPESQGVTEHEVIAEAPPEAKKAENSSN